MPTQRIRVQEHVKLSGRNYLAAKAYHDIAGALRAMVSRARIAKAGYNVYNPSTDDIDNNATITTDNETNITVQCGRSIRVFTLVHKRGGEAINFGSEVK